MNQEHTYKQIVVQVDRTKAESLGMQTVKVFADFSQAHIKGVLEKDVHEGVDDGVPYINFTYRSFDARSVWNQLRATINTLSPELFAASIVICEGVNGWDDYLLLHHFDPQSKLDSFPD